MLGVAGLLQGSRTKKWKLLQQVTGGRPVANWLHLEEIQVT
jgi:hypothetical protein